MVGGRRARKPRPEEGLKRNGRRKRRKEKQNKKLFLFLFLQLCLIYFFIARWFIHGTKCVKMCLI
jgi:hypothetical protein